jgi:hypothetical protein
MDKEMEAAIKAVKLELESEALEEAGEEEQMYNFDDLKADVKVLFWAFLGWFVFCVFTV